MRRLKAKRTPRGELINLVKYRHIYQWEVRLKQSAIKYLESVSLTSVCFQVEVNPEITMVNPNTGKDQMVFKVMDITADGVNRLYGIKIDPGVYTIKPQATS